MPCRNPCRLYIYLAFTYSVGHSSGVWSELGPAPPFPPMRVLEFWWSWALSLVFEVALGPWTSSPRFRASSCQNLHDPLHLRATSPNPKSIAAPNCNAWLLFRLTAAPTRPSCCPIQIPALILNCLAPISNCPALSNHRCQLDRQMRTAKLLQNLLNHPPCRSQRFLILLIQLMCGLLNPMSTAPPNRHT